MIAALLPMAFVTGLMGPYMSPIPINASMGMLISLAIAFVVTPWLALQARAAAAHAAHGPGRARPAARARRSRGCCTPFLDRDARRRNRRALLGVGIVVAILAVGVAARSCSWSC